MLVRLWRVVWLAAAAVVALVVGAVLLLLALLTVLVLWLRARITGRPLVWASWQTMAAQRATQAWSTMRSAPGARPFGFEGGKAAADVVDVSAREVTPGGPSSSTGGPIALPRQDDSR